MDDYKILAERLQRIAKAYIKEKFLHLESLCITIDKSDGRTNKHEKYLVRISARAMDHPLLRNTIFIEDDRIYFRGTDYFYSDPNMFPNLKTAIKSWVYDR